MLDKTKSKEIMLIYDIGNEKSIIYTITYVRKYYEIGIGYRILVLEKSFREFYNWIEKIKINRRKNLNKADQTLMNRFPENLASPDSKKNKYKRYLLIVDGG